MKDFDKVLSLILLESIYSENESANGGKINMKWPYMYSYSDEECINRLFDDELLVEDGKDYVLLTKKGVDAVEKARVEDLKDQTLACMFNITGYIDDKLKDLGLSYSYVIGRPPLSENSNNGKKSEFSIQMCVNSKSKDGVVMCSVATVDIFRSEIRTTKRFKQVVDDAVIGIKNNIKEIATQSEYS